VEAPRLRTRGVHVDVIEVVCGGRGSENERKDESGCGDDTENALADCISAIAAAARKAHPGLVYLILLPCVNVHTDVVVDDDCDCFVFILVDFN